MSSAGVFESPTVTDADICRASRLLGLPVDAFYGLDGTDKRQEVLKCMDSIDVAACPGSGKTTLLVAKLAILAETWQYGTRGVCVLSHTNAARHEIEKHLGNTAAGRRLLGYPHYIGTIHGFVNEFLTLPLLRSHGYGNTRFDSEIAGRKILKLSGGGKNLPGYLYRKIADQNTRIKAVSYAHYVGENLDIRLSAENVQVDLTSSSNSDTFKKIKEWKKTILKDGYASYEDTFAYGHWALKKYSTLTETIRHRFPILLIDEAQDNSNAQSAILNQIFVEGNSPVMRQRFGDANQAIFDFQGAKEAETDKFPGLAKIELLNSHRFGQKIADLADPLGLVPYGLQGLGPRTRLASGAPAGQHTIFLFDENSAHKVLDAYGALLLETFSDVELREVWFAATAVGQVHKPPEEEKAKKFPHHVGHYWPDYDPSLAKHEPTPQTFMQYVFVGLGKSELRHESHAMVEKIAEGFLRLLDFGADKKPLTRRRHFHRHILQKLETTPDAKKQYQDLVMQFTVNQELPSLESWENHWRGQVLSIAERIAGGKLSEEANEFLSWNDELVVSAPSPSGSKSRNNLFSFCKNGREVSIQAGSIHSVKGQTHTATLVLETFWNGHNLEHILPWFIKEKHGWESADLSRQKSRLKLHYVAMTRPTHLLCLAMKQSALTEEHVKAVQARGWRLVQVQPDGNTTLIEST